jgi:hypothetical protein
MADLDEIYEGSVQQELDQTSTESTDAVGEEASTPPVPEDKPDTPEVDWRAKSEQSDKRAEEAERKAAGIERALAASRSKVREQAPDFQQDPAAFIENMRREFQSEVQNVRIESLQSSARARYSDYDAKETAFLAIAEQNPYLIAQMQKSADPAEFAYKTAEYHLALQEAGGSLDALKRRISDELQAGNREKHAATAALLPKTLSGAAGTGRKAQEVYAGPVPLTSIYKNR